MYKLGQDLQVSVKIDSQPGRRVSRVVVHAVQAVDVSMFTSGAFKNVVASDQDKISGKRFKHKDPKFQMK